MRIEGAFCLVLVACGASTTNQSSPLPETPRAQGGALPPLNASAAKRERYTFEDGGTKEFLTFEMERVRISASCLAPNGSLACDAMTTLRKGTRVKLPMDAPVGVSPGALVCKQMGLRNQTGRAATGNEDGFCLFPDGSMASTGTLDMYIAE